MAREKAKGQVLGGYKVSGLEDGLKGKKKDQKCLRRERGALSTQYPAGRLMVQVWVQSALVGH